MADARDSHRKHLAQALILGEYEWPPHKYSLVGPFLMYYLQGMLMSVWHIELGTVRHLPILWPQDVAIYRKHQIKFERSVRTLERGK